MLALKYFVIYWRHCFSKTKKGKRGSLSCFSRHIRGKKATKSCEATRKGCFCIPQNRGGRITRDWKSQNRGARKSPNRGARITGGLKSKNKGFHHLVTSQPRCSRQTITAYL